MDAQLIQDQIELGLISSDILLAGTKLVDESSRQAGDYKDANHFPFYYHLGKQLVPKTVYQIGAKLGLVGACFLRSCKSVEDWFVADEAENHTASIINSNLKLNWREAKPTFVVLTDSMLEETTEYTGSFPGFDLCLLTDDFGKDRYLKHLTFLWKYLAPEGLLVADYINSHDVFHEFCRVNNREPVIFNTRYGIGIIQR